MVSHHNVISNVLQVAMAENTGRDKNGGPSQTALGLLPLSHIYGLTIIAHVCMFVGDEIVILPKFELDQMLAVIDKYSINMLFLVRHTLLALRVRAHAHRFSGPADHRADPQQQENPREV